MQYREHYRTSRYLGPILNTFPKVFISESNKVKIGLGVMDALYYKTRQIKPRLFVAVDFNQVYINTCRQVKWWEDDYPYNLEDKYMIVFNIPEEFHNSYWEFLKGRYSRMYTKDQLTKLKIPAISGGKLNPIYNVLTRHPLALTYLQSKIEDRYGTQTVSDDPDEYDLPPRIGQEVFNSKGNEEFIKSICELKNI